MQEVRHAVRNHLALVRNAVERHTVGQFLLKSIDHPIHLVAHGHDILILLHLHREEETLPSVIRNVAIWFGILAHHVRHILQSDNMPLRIRIHNLLLHVAHGIQ